MADPNVYSVTRTVSGKYTHLCLGSQTRAFCGVRTPMVVRIDGKLLKNVPAQDTKGHVTCMSCAGPNAR